MVKDESCCGRLCSFWSLHRNGCKKCFKLTGIRFKDIFYKIELLVSKYQAKELVCITQLRPKVSSLKIQRNFNIWNLTGGSLYCKPCLQLELPLWSINNNKSIKCQRKWILSRISLNASLQKF